MPIVKHRRLESFKGSIVALASSQTATNHLKNTQLRTKTAPSEAASPKSNLDHLQETQLRATTAPRGVAPPTLLRCIIVSWSDQRAEFFRSAAENESWETVVCSETGEFMRNLFRLKFPLTIVDLPQPDSEDYEAMRHATERTRSVSDSLLVVSVFDESQEDEIWSRQLGAWAHLPGASNATGLEMIFREAREALARQESIYGPQGRSGAMNNY